MLKPEVLYELTQKELAPDKALEIIDQTTNLDDLLEVLLYFTHHFARAIVEAKDDVEMKAEAIFHLGEIFNSLYLAIYAFPLMSKLSLYDIPEEYLFKRIKDHLIYLGIQYARVKDGEPLENVALRLKSRAILARSFIEDLTEKAYSTLRDLNKERQSLTAEA